MLAVRAQCRALAQDEVGTLLGHHDRWGTRLATNYVRHRRRVDHSKRADAAHAQLRVEHLRARMVDGDGVSGGEEKRGAKDEDVVVR